MFSTGTGDLTAVLSCEPSAAHRRGGVGGRVSAVHGGEFGGCLAAGDSDHPHLVSRGMIGTHGEKFVQQARVGIDKQAAKVLKPSIAPD